MIISYVTKHQEIGWFDEESHNTGALCARLSTSAEAVASAGGGKILLVASETYLLNVARQDWDAAERDHDPRCLRWVGLKSSTLECGKDLNIVAQNFAQESIVREALQ